LEQESAGKKPSYVFRHFTCMARLIFFVKHIYFLLMLGTNLMKLMKFGAAQQLAHLDSSYIGYYIASY